jgi:hypothetical protein
VVVKIFHGLVNLTEILNFLLATRGAYGLMETKHPLKFRCDDVIYHKMNM